MEKDQIKLVCTSLLDEKPPLKVVNLAHRLLVQSKPKLPLKADKEHARPYICSLLAIEQEDLDADLSQLPLPKKTFDQLVAQFKKTLFSDSKSPLKRTPQKSQKEHNFIENVRQIKKRRTVARGDAEQLFVDLQEKLELAADTFKMMVQTFAQYKEHVHDKWGFAMAVAYVLIQRVEPDKAIGLERCILQTAQCPTPQNRLDAFLPWAVSILNSQPELVKLAVVPEQVLTLYGGTGAWTFDLEPSEWWKADSATAD